MKTGGSLDLEITRRKKKKRDQREKGVEVKRRERGLIHPQKGDLRRVLIIITKTRETKTIQNERVGLGLDQSQIQNRNKETIKSQVTMDLIKEIPKSLLTKTRFQWSSSQLGSPKVN